MPTPPPPDSPPLTLAAVDPGKLYPLAAVGEVYSRSPVVIERWCRAGRIAARKVMGRWMVIGDEILKLWGEQLLADQVPARGPTERELNRKLAELDAREARRKHQGRPARQTHGRARR